MSGRQAKVLQEQAGRYGLPIGEASIDLTKFARALHDFLAHNARKLTAPDKRSPGQVGSPDPAFDLVGLDAAGEGVSSPALERLREVRVLQDQIKLDLMRADAIPRRDLEPSLAKFAGILRRAGETLQRQYGDDAAAVLNEAVAEAVASWETMLAGTDAAAEVDSSDAAGGVADPTAGEADKTV